MWKKFLISIIIIFILVIGIIVFNRTNTNSEAQKNSENLVNNEIDLSTEYVTDECVNEWRDYSLTVQEEIKEANQNLSDENKTYIVKEEDDYIKVYYINNKNEEILYKVTDIAVQYLGKDDVKKLKQGIKVIGLQELNQLLEDFEWFFFIGDCPVCEMGQTLFKKCQKSPVPVDKYIENMV